MNIAVMNIHVQALFAHKFLFLLGKYLGHGMAWYVFNS